jgi:hypothetical protein
MTKASRKAQSALLAGSWAWRIPAVQPAVQPIIQPENSQIGADVGVGEDWSHLNKRRRRARVGKVARDLKIAKKNGSKIEEQSGEVSGGPRAPSLEDGVTS